MENLAGKTILIGKEPGQGRLLVALSEGGQQRKTMAIGLPGSVPSSVSRCVPNEGIGHCKIDIDLSGNIQITNLKPLNVTMVDGMEIVTKRVTKASHVTLGKDRFPIDLGSVLAAAEKIIKVTGGEVKPEFSIRHLEAVWNAYHSQIIGIKKRQHRIGLWRSLPILFTVGSTAVGGVLTHFMPELSWIPILTGCMFGTGVVLMVYGFYLSSTDKSIEKTEAVTDEFQSKYVCPNPQCCHFMGMQPYKILRQNKKCPYCGCHLTEK